MKDINDFDYPIPFTSELIEQGLMPYRTNEKLKRKIDYLFRHVKFEHRQLFIDVSTSGCRGLTKDMANRAVSVTRHFMLNPQQYGHKMENITLQIFVRMWKQTFKHCVYQHRELDKYYSTKMVLLSIENGLIEELIRTVEEKDYIQSNDDMVKRRDVVSTFTNKKVGLRDRVSHGTHEGSDNFEYLCSLE